MSSASSVGSSSSGSSTTATNSMQSLTAQDFMNMLVTELQNQDPTQPVSNSEILTEVGQIDSIQSNTNLNTTLQSVLLEQNMNTGSSLMNQTVTGKDASGNTVSGQVNSITITNGAVTLNIGSDTMSLSNVTSVAPASSASGG